MRTLVFALLAAVVALMFLAAPDHLHAVAHASSLPLAVAGMAFPANFDRVSLSAPSGLVFNMASPAERIQALEGRREELMAASQAILDGLEDGEDLTDEQTQSIDDNNGEVERIDKQIGAMQKLVPQGRGRSTTAEPQNRGGDPTGTGRRTVPASPRDSQRHGFTGLGEFALAVRDQKIGSENDGTRKLMAAATTYGNEGAGADAGFLVPPEYSNAIMEKVMAEDSLLSRAMQVQTQRNALVINKEETTPWGAAGIQVYWESEAGAITASKPKVEPTNIRLVKLSALVPLTDELLEDSIGLDSLVRAVTPGRMNAAINTGFFSGTGVRQPLGMLKSGSLISVAKETSQPASTVHYANIVKMFSRMYAPWRRNGVWLINQDVEPQLYQMAFDPDATSKVPAYMPPGGLSASPYGTLLGRPVIPLEACSALGTQGDIAFVDMQQYLALTKAGGVQTATSIHLYFDQSITALRFVFRINGQPLWSSAITPQNGSNTRSWCVTLDTRA